MEISEIRIKKELLIKKAIKSIDDLAENFKKETGVSIDITVDTKSGRCEVELDI